MDAGAPSTPVVVNATTILSIIDRVRTFTSEGTFVVSKQKSHRAGGSVTTPIGESDNPLLSLGKACVVLLLWTGSLQLGHERGSTVQWTISPEERARCYLVAQVDRDGNIQHCKQYSRQSISTHVKKICDQAYVAMAYYEKAPLFDATALVTGSSKRTVCHEEVLAACERVTAACARKDILLQQLDKSNGNAAASYKAALVQYQEAIMDHYMISKKLREQRLILKGQQACNQHKHTRTGGWIQEAPGAVPALEPRVTASPPAKKAMISRS
eukprot:TRINITY_DN14446_c0_g1_i2.p1 TRINITY_DN14446_c0_g1~~TRINITY_DN14446_c0_g1_i2.p1  ORF type:complete len:291 (+),score=32.01 TRINITY_DN14446_c0_g1_i2:64-873(+)